MTEDRFEGAAQTLCENAPRGPRLSKHLAIICWSNQLSSINLQMANTSCVETVDFKLIVQILIDVERFLETEANVRYPELLYRLNNQEIG